MARLKDTAGSTALTRIKESFMLLSLSGFLFQSQNPSEQPSFPDFCAKASSFGYRGVELRQGYQINQKSPLSERREKLRIVKDNGLKVTCLTARNLPKAGEERDVFFKRYVELCNDMECGLMKIGSDPEWCRWAAKTAEAAGVTLASNNHVGGQLETVDGTRQFLNSVDHPNFGLLFDCMHLRSTGQDYIGCIPEFAAYTKNILIQSRRRDRSEQWTPALPDEKGVQDWRAVFSAFRKQGYDGLVTVIENSWPYEQREEVARKCADILPRFWHEVGS